MGNFPKGFVKKILDDMTREAGRKAGEAQHRAFYPERKQGWAVGPTGPFWNSNRGPLLDEEKYQVTPCPDCKGTGEITLFTTTSVCDCRSTVVGPERTLEEVAKEYFDSRRRTYEEFYNRHSYEDLAGSSGGNESPRDCLR